MFEDKKDNPIFRKQLNTDIFIYDTIEKQFE